MLAVGFGNNRGMDCRRCAACTADTVDTFHSGAAIRGGIMNKIMWTRPETAAALGVSAETIIRWTASGRMPKPVKIKYVVRYHADTIRAWAAEGSPHVARGGWRPSGNGA